MMPTSVTTLEGGVMPWYEIIGGVSNVDIDGNNAL
jgi:hypothetical protein